jgi:hypothetical protein
MDWARCSEFYKSGPAREVHGGSGYWSRDETVQVMWRPHPPVKLQVRWPWGSTITVEVPDGAREIAVDATGKRALPK